MIPKPQDPAETTTNFGRHIQTGRKGESLALTWLLSRGYTLRESNYRFGRHGELDLIMDAPDGDIVFVEVKSSRQDRAGDPTGWVTPRKQYKIQRIAQAWCLQRGIGDCAMRFDVVGVAMTADGEATITHIPHAFLPDGSGYWRTGR
jgi:putative endonuclease